MAVHEEVLEAANRIIGNRADGTFAPEEVVRLLPHLNENSVRTHIVSRCCKNAPSNHAHRLSYFTRVGRGRYKVEAKYRNSPDPPKSNAPSLSPGALRQTIHCVIYRDGTAYTAESLEFAVVTQGDTLDEAVHNLKDALNLHLEDEDLPSVGFCATPRVQVAMEFPLAP